jgi:hypothetical protein
VLGRRIAMGIVLAALVAPALIAPAAHAHHIRRTALYVDFGSRSVALEIRMPLEELSFARGKLVKLTDWRVDPADVRELTDYVRAHLKVQRGGETLALSIGSISIETENLLVVHAVARASRAEPLRAIDLRYDGITDRVNTHETYVFVRRDLTAGQLGEAPKLYSTLHWQHRAVHIERAPGGWTQGFTAVFKLGVVHIAQGTDHLLFLLMLLLPAPLFARERRWIEPRTVKQSLRATFWIVTAFTIGHSLTLIAGALRGLALPAQPVEVLIAFSILVSAIHAFRPLFAGREPFVAAGFGLVHGLAFARELLGFGFDGGSLALALFGFNLGIEAMQLVVVLVVLPVLLFASRSPRYAWLRIAGAACGAVASIGWIGERAFNLSSRIPMLANVFQ